MKRCWADILGGCSKEFSKEHYLGRRLLGNGTVRTRGLHPNLEERSIPVTDLQAHILCRGHNSRLSEVDQEAISLRTGLEQLFHHQDKKNLLKGNGLWTPPQYKVNGALLGRWLCKLHCNYLTLKGIVPPEYYVRTAFGQHTDPAPRFYLRVQLQDVLVYQQRIWYLNFSGGPCRHEEYGTFHVFFMGFHFLVCPCDLTEEIKARLAHDTRRVFYGGDWMEKPQKIRMEQDGIVVKSLAFDWGTQPSPRAADHNH